MTKVIILGSGAASGVPSITGNWGVCNPHNPKNNRRRAGIYIEENNTGILIDTSCELRQQLLDNKIKTVDGVLYTHTHGDHLLGINDLRGITKEMNHKGLNIYAIDAQINDIRKHFPYVFMDATDVQITHRPELIANVINYNEKFKIGSFEIMPLEFQGHPVVTTGYDIDNGKVVIIPDYKVIPEHTLEYLCGLEINLLIMPLTSVKAREYHAGMSENLKYIDKIGAKQVVFTHMSGSCDYDEVEKMTPENIHPAYDNMMIEI